MIDRPTLSESGTMERKQLARYSGVILGSRSEWHSKKCSQRGDPTGTTYEQSLAGQILSARTVRQQNGQ